MEASLERELKQLKRRKLKAQGKGDLTEEAKLCNAVGELLAQYGYFEKAVKEHTREVQLSEAIQDTIGSAVAHRKVGECLCALKKYKEALFHQNLHLKLAQSAGDLVEEQRALATIGRTWFVHSDDAISADELEECLLESQRAYLKSLAICDKLQQTVSEKDLLEMKSRLYLNLGLTYEKDSQTDCPKAKSFMEKALIIARDQGLRNTEYRCLLSIGSIRMKSDEEAHALRCFEQALVVARNDNNKFDEADALDMLGKLLPLSHSYRNDFVLAMVTQFFFTVASPVHGSGYKSYKVFLKLGEFSAGCLNLKKAYRINKTKRSADLEELKSNLATAIKGIRYQRKHARLSEYSLAEQLKILDKLGDLYCQAKAYQKALGCYKKELELAKVAGKSHKELSPIYVSLAITYFDLKCPADAISCYMEELEIMEEDNHKERCDTWCNIAYVHEKAGHGYEEIEDCYLKALEFAQLSGNQQAVLRVWKCLADTQKLFNLNDKFKNSLKKVTELQSEFGIEDDSDDEKGDNNDGDDDEMTDVLIEREMLLPDSDEDNYCDDEYDGEGSRKRNNPNLTRTRRSKQKHVNEKGETPLHEAAIAGSLQHVKALLEKGADVNARDYCGWLPLHEACNHGHLEVVELLLQAGSDVNDQGGEHCYGVTPLHDASENGHLEVVKLLLSNGASINLKDSKGRTALDATVEVFKINVGKADDDIMNGRKQVVKYLRRYKERGGDAELQRRRNQIQDKEDQEDNEEEETTSSTLQTFNEKLKKKEYERLQRMNRNVSKERQEDVEAFPSADMTQYGAFISDEELSQGNEREVTIFSYPSVSSTELPGIFSDDMELTRPQTRDGVDNIHSDCIEPSSDVSAFEEDDLNNGDSPITSVDLDHEVEMVDLEDENNVNTSNSLYIDPVTGMRTNSYSDGQVSSLVTEKTAQWLVDDMGPRPAKRKRPAKQTKLPGVMEQKKRTSTVVRPTPRLSLSKSKPSHPKQTKLVVSKEPRIHQNAMCGLDSSVNIISNPANARRDLVTAVSGGNSRVNTLETNTQNNMAIGGPPPMRLKVRVQDKVFLIPCPRNNTQESKNIGWLAEQASLRYFSSFGLRPVLALKTSEGAFMSPEDKIIDVLSSNEEVVASVESWDLPALSERYQDACINSNTTARADILSILEADPQLTSLSLSNKALQDVHVLPLCRALQCHDTLTKLMLPGNRIGDSGVQHLVSALPTIPSLAILDLSSNGITQKGLSYVASALNTRDSARMETQQDTTLQKLEEFNISYNWLGDSAGSSLAVILKKCPILNSLRVESCGLTSQVAAQGKEFAVALKVCSVVFPACRLLQLSVAYNALGPQGVVNLVMALPCESLHHLNVTSSMDDKASYSAIQSLLKFMETSGCVLSDLLLGDCEISDNDLQLLFKATHMFSGLHHLDLSCNNIGSDGISILSRLLKDSKLSVLILAGNGSIGTTGTESLLIAAKESRNLQKLNLSACGIKSPLPVTFFDALKNVASQIIKEGFLKELDLSHNCLSVDDKARLAEEWDSSTGKSSVCLEDTLCVFTK